MILLDQTFSPWSIERRRDERLGCVEVEFGICSPALLPVPVRCAVAGGAALVEHNQRCQEFHLLPISFLNRPAVVVGGGSGHDDTASSTSSKNVVAL